VDNSSSTQSSTFATLGRVIGPITVVVFFFYIIFNWSNFAHASDISVTWAFVGLILTCGFWDFKRHEVLVCILATYLIYDTALLAAGDLKLPNIIITIVMVAAGILRLRQMGQLKPAQPQIQ
jgi:hypothetical protein